MGALQVFQHIGDLHSIAALRPSEKLKRGYVGNTTLLPNASKLDQIRLDEIKLYRF